MNINILIVDDEPSACDLCVEILRSIGLKTETTESGAQALAFLEGRRVDVVLTDIRMPGMNGIELLKLVRQKYPKTKILTMTGYGTIQEAVEVIKHGAYDYLTKPFKIDEFEQVFQRLAQEHVFSEETRARREQLNQTEGFAGLVGTSAAMQKVFRMIRKIASKRLPVLILGESGTGKELVAHAIHAQSPWKDNPFVTVDCGALPPTLIESELFGHVRGAFTGASHSRQGLLALAQGGTVFLDEIAELPIGLQVKLLRAIQENQVRAVGGNGWTQLNARIIAATNQELSAAADNGTFRKDLFYRLNVFSMRMPSLRERKSDIPSLTNYFLAKYADDEGPTPMIAYNAMARLMNYSWPGNVRELENCIHRALALGAGPYLEAKDLPSPLHYIKSADEGDETPPPLKDIQRTSIMKALKAAGGNPVRAAELLRIGKTTIYRKIKEFRIEESLGRRKKSVRENT